MAVRAKRAISLLATTCLLATSGARAAQATSAQQVVGRTSAESSPPRWPVQIRPAKGAPNILVIITDDVGFGASSTFGGPIATPTMDRLATRGLRFNRFHTTALCSPTRASLLTGRTPHNAGVGMVTNLPSAYEGYTGVIGKQTATVARILRDAGYNTAMFGKGHITPEWEMSRAGPFERWPTGLGFEYFYGFLGPDTSAFHSTLVEDTAFRTIPSDASNYHFEHDVADHAIAWIGQQRAAAPDRPFLAYYATGAAHAPNQAPDEWLAKFRGRFDEGWDAMWQHTVERQKAGGIVPRDARLPARPTGMPAWESLSPEKRRYYARLMEAYAASLAFADHEIGRVIKSLEDSGQLENTMIVYIQGDNGASAEGRRDGQMFEQSMVNNFDDTGYIKDHLEDIGTQRSYPIIPAGFAWALNAPFPWFKRNASHLGGVRNGMVISWPKGIATAGLRSQFHHVSDIAPTILDVAGVAPPAEVDGIAQKPFDGVSLRYTFNAEKAPPHRTLQIFEMMENLAIYKDGWIAATTPTVSPWDDVKARPVAIDQRAWELYDLDHDFAEANDLAAAQPARLAQMKEIFWAEAGRSGILPIHGMNDGTAEMPGRESGQTRFVYGAGAERVPEANAPDILGKSFRITADFTLDRPGQSGVLVAQGGRFGGYSLYLKDGLPVFFYNAVGARQYRFPGKAPLPAGKHVLEIAFKPDSSRRGSGGAVSMSVDGKIVGGGNIAQAFSLWISHTEGLDVGRDTITAVSPDYTPETSAFPARIDRIVYDTAKE